MAQWLDVMIWISLVKKHNLKTVFISDIVAYRLANERLVNEIKVEEMEFFGANVKQHIFKDHDEVEHTALVFGSIDAVANVRVHNVVADIELLLNQKKYNNLINSIEYLKKNNGVLVFINKTNHQDNAAMKEIGTGAQILKNLGVSKMNIITSMKQTDFVGLSGFGLEVSEIINI